MGEPQTVKIVGTPFLHYSKTQGRPVWVVYLPADEDAMSPEAANVNKLLTEIVPDLERQVSELRAENDRLRTKLLTSVLVDSEDAAVWRAVEERVSGAPTPSPSPEEHDVKIELVDADGKTVTE